MWSLPFSYSVGERKLMNHFVVNNSGRDESHPYVSIYFLNAAGSNAAPLSVYALFTSVGRRIVWIT